MKTIVSRCFFFDMTKRYINHAGLGATPKVVRRAQVRFLTRVERNGGRVLEDDLTGFTHAAASGLASLMRCEEDNICFVSTATAGTASIVLSVLAQQRMPVYISRSTYGPIKKAAFDLASQMGAAVHFLDDEPTVFPAESHADLKPFSELLPSGPFLLLVPHISSRTGSLMPIEELVALCQRRGGLICVDGAAAVGGIPIDFSKGIPDFYVGTAYKWLFAPKPAAFVMVQADRVKCFRDRYFNALRCEDFIATIRDHSAVASIPTALSFWHEQGGESLQLLNIKLVSDAVDYVIGQLGTYAYRATGTTPVNLVALPVSWSKEKCREVQRSLFYEDHIDSRIFEDFGRTWVRISAQVYNEMSDYEFFCAALKRYFNS